MRRREFITLLGGAVTSWPRAARAQKPSVPVIGVLGVGLPEPNPPFVVAFQRGLAESGYVPDQNVTIEYRWTIYVRDLPHLAAELVSRKVDVIVTTGSPYSAVAAKAATSTIPIVFELAFDPVKYGLVTSLNRPGGPGGNVTGMTFLSSELPGKRLSLLLDLIPPATRIAYLSLPIAPISEDLKSEILSAARSLGREIIPLEFPGSAESRYFETAFKALVEQRAGALLVGNFSSFLTNRHQIVELAARHKIPAMYPDRLYVADGGLMSYAARGHGPRELALIYVAQILKGAKPTELPIRRPTEFDLTINLKTAKTLGLTIPRRLLAAATELIE
jgi:putative ABC transport system substrate-binding protein